MRRPKGPGYRKWEGLPKGVVTLAQSRTDYLRTAHVIGLMPLPMMLANAYLQGIADATETAAAMMSREGFDPTVSKQTTPEGLS